MIQPAFEILNQRGTPMFFSDVFANRPTAGIVGRIFISTDTYAFYRDTGSGWDLIGGPGSGTITGSGTIGTLPIWNGTQVIGDSSLLEGASKFTTTKDFQADGYYLSGMTAGSGALYWTSDRVTLANYNPTGDVHIEVAGGQAAQVVLGSNLSTTFYGNIIRNGGLSTQFLKADGSLDSSTYITTNIYNGNGTLSGNRVVSLNSNYLSFAGGQIYIGSQTASSGLLTINNASSDAHIQVVGASAPSIRIDNAGTGATQRLVFGLVTATNNFIQGSTAGDICISTASASPLLFGMWQTINASEVMRITTATNFLIGGTIDGGQKFQVTGTSYFNGNVGIGVSPTQRLDVRRSTNDGIIALLHQSTGYGFTIGSSETSAYLSSGYLQTFVLKTDAGSGQVNRITISNDGNLGLGVTPNAWSGFVGLQVAANISLWSSTSGGGTAYYSNNLYYNGSNRIFITSGYASEYQQQSNGNHAWFISPSGTAGNPITFTQAMTLNASGNLGIGSTNPTNLISGTEKVLVISGSNLASLYLESTGNRTWGNYVNSAGTLTWYDITGAATRMSMPTSGNLLIGTTTDAGYKLQVNGTNGAIAISGSGYVTNPTSMLLGLYTSQRGYIQVPDQGAIEIWKGSTSEIAKFKNNGDTILYGNVGINEVAPTSKLQLNGTLRIDGQTSVTAGGSSGQHLIINCDGTTYKIALLNN